MTDDKIEDSKSERESTFWPGVSGVRSALFEGSGLVEKGGEMPPAPNPYDAQLQPPYALTDQRAAALERAIRAEGYTILCNPETGDIKLERVK